MAVTISGWSSLIPNPEVFRARRGGAEVPIPDQEDLQYQYEERCAILEFDGGFSRKEAEALALTMIPEYENYPPA